MNKRRHGRPFRCVGRWTVPRQAVIDAFIKNRGHLAAEEVFMYIKKTYPGIGIATVYRNLEFLREKGLINRFQFNTDKAYYELNDDEREHHHHLICTSCGKVLDYSEFIERELDLMNDLEKELSAKHNFQISSHQLHFYGICSKCR
ncbi:MAG: transcriptional repressor [Elusimicrobiota bacterium]